VDTGVNHSRLEGGFGESGCSIAGAATTARDIDSLLAITVIGECSTALLPTLRTPHRPIPFQSSVFVVLCRIQEVDAVRPPDEQSAVEYVLSGKAQHPRGVAEG
jgi:hypothetical protein